MKTDDDRNGLFCQCNTWTSSAGAGWESPWMNTGVLNAVTCEPLQLFFSCAFPFRSFLNISSQLSNGGVSRRSGGVASRRGSCPSSPLLVILLQYHFVLLKSTSTTEKGRRGQMKWIKAEMAKYGSMHLLKQVREEGGGIRSSLDLCIIANKQQ